MTADPPRQLAPGVHFDLGLAVNNALEIKFPDTDLRGTLLARFGIPVGDPDTSWLDDLLAGPESQLLQLAQYLDVALPGNAGDTDETVPADTDAYAELVSAETALRQVIRLAVPNWIADLTQEEVTKLEGKRAEEDKRRDGITVSQDLLDYTEVYQLEKTINKHWDAVKSVLDDKKRTDVYLGIMADVRNSIAHARPVFAAERLLLAGAAGQIRNQLAKHRAKADGPQRHYPSLDSARDSMGNTAESDPYFSGGQPYVSRPPAQRLEVGDTVTFELEGTDPRGRDLIWTAHSIPSNVSAGSFRTQPVIGQATGERVQITWTVSEYEVGEHRQVAIVLANSGLYHRHGVHDDACAFRYHVNPPPDA